MYSKVDHLSTTMPIMNLKIYLEVPPHPQLDETAQDNFCKSNVLGPALYEPAVVVTKQANIGPSEGGRILGLPTISQIRSAQRAWHNFTITGGKTTGAAKSSHCWTYRVVEHSRGV